MKKSELAKILKPLIKECVKEVIFEEGVLSTIVSEVVQGMGAVPIVEKQSTKINKKDSNQDEMRLHERKQKLVENRKKMLDAINKDAYNGVDLFENTRPISSAGVPSDKPPAPMNPLAGVEPNDPGLDISSLIGGMNYKGTF